ncbi:hypothetical protein BDA96_01G508400 [Sorghum bicolor]|uniref:RING-type E3 ubiquitin transferase n=1 Tax=Sorghum bicolor TaxID=4558 RepID=A0A921S666_SORBI|nr:hypothetical protein BDA96_01G508100 [Sorghum bicolor]KAG0552451.1 hypothetical protein BDA96_01G508400 [Sorghum bicolor]
MEEARVGENWGFGNLGGRTYTIRRQRQRQRQRTPPPPPSPGLEDPEPHPDGSEEGESSSGEGEFQGPVNIRAYGAALWALLQQQGKRGRVTASSDADILRLLHEVTPAGSGCCSSDCCAICLEDFDDAAAADPLSLRAMPSCSHVFHKHCILKWLRLNAVCPVCRCQLPTEDEDDEEEARRSSSRRRRSTDPDLDAWLALVAQARERQRHN